MSTEDMFTSLAYDRQLTCELLDWAERRNDGDLVRRMNARLARISKAVDYLTLRSERYCGSTIDPDAQCPEHGCARQDCDADH